MNLKTIGFIKNFSYTILSNLISLVVSILVVLIVPKLIGVEEYGYWQIYLFYVSYVGFLHFGWNDGVYLRYGGEEYSELDKRLFYSQFYTLLFFQVIIAFVLLFLARHFANGNDRLFVLQMVSVCLVLTNVRYMLLFILQATNRIKEYALITILERVFYLTIIFVLLIFGNRDYRLMIVADLIGKSISLTYAMFTCKEIVFNKMSSFYFTFPETLENINVGIKLMFANIASMLIIGIVRFGIERTWDVTTFGKVSLTLSISNMMMIFINALGIIMFPILRRTSRERLSNIYSTMRDFLMVLLLGGLIIYYPLKKVIEAWLPQYSESLLYMALVFPMFIFEGKMALLINSYLKTLRREKVMLKINLISMCISIVITFISTQIVSNLNLAVLNIVILLATRSIYSEIYLAKELKIRVKKDILLEVSLTIVFILTGWFVNSLMTMPIYGMAYIIYLFIKRKDITGTIYSIKSLIKA